jgi:hypothetical protein
MDRDQYHVYVLEVSTDHVGRHNDCTAMGHLTTTDFRTYSYHGAVLTPASVESQPDSLSIWAGSTITIHNITYLFYTLLQKNADNPLIQTIGFATSCDLFTFRKHSNNPVLRPLADGLYSVPPNRRETGTRSAFRDPFPFRISSEEIYIAFSAQTGEGLYDACVGLACATLRPAGPLGWKFLDPIFCPNLFAEIELPFLICMGDYWYLFFSAKDYDTHSGPSVFKQREHRSGLFCFCSEHGPWGPFYPVNQTGLVIDADELLAALGYDLYGVRPILGTEDLNNQTIAAQGWIRRSRHVSGYSENMVGRLAAPIRLKLDPRRVDWARGYTWEV